MQNFNSQSLINRMMGAARLDVATYEEVEKDQSATTQALIVVVLAAVAGGIGALREDGVSGLIGGIILSIIGWAAFSFFVYIVGTRFFPTGETQADTGQVMRTLGFAYTPQILGITLLIPVLGAIISFIASIWFLVCSIVAIRQSLEMSTGRAIVTAIVAFIGYIIVAVIIALIFGLSLGG